MERKRTALLLLVVAAVASTAVVAVAPAAAAPNGTTSTSGSGASAAPGTSGGGNSNATYVAQIDSTTRIVDYSYQAGTFTVTLEADRPTMVGVADALGPFAQDGAAQIPMKRKLVPAGQTTITMSVEEWRGRAAVSVSTARGAVALSTEGGASTIWPDEGSDRLALAAGVVVSPLAALAWGRYRGDADEESVTVVDDG
jgi:hypothetical protein